MKFRKYHKVERWDHKDEVEGLNKGTVHIQEKIDGANGQVYFHEDYLYVGKRSGVVGKTNSYSFTIIDEFRGFPKTIFQNKAYKNFFLKYPYLRLYGEWLVKHTVIYSPENLKRFWIFDVYNDKEERFLKYEEYIPILEEFHLDFIPVIEIKQNPTMQELLDMVKVKNKIPKSSFGAETIEGLVYKNYDFVNRYGRCVYMKAVTKDFREIHHLVMGANKYDTPEVYIAAKYLTTVRMEKIFKKMIDEKNILTMKDIPEFIEKSYHDVITEDAWQIFGKNKKFRNAKISIYDLRKAITDKARNWFISKLQEESLK